MVILKYFHVAQLFDNNTAPITSNILHSILYINDLIYLAILHLRKQTLCGSTVFRKAQYLHLFGSIALRKTNSICTYLAVLLLAKQTALIFAFIWQYCSWKNTVYSIYSPTYFSICVCISPVLKRYSVLLLLLLNCCYYFNGTYTIVSTLCANGEAALLI